MRSRQSYSLASVGCLTVALLGAIPAKSADAGSWRAVTEAGVTYQPEEGPLDPGHPEHWRWGGAFGAVREVGALGALGPVFVGSANENDYALGVGIRWTREMLPGWHILVTPGFVAHDLMKADQDLFPGYFGEIGISYDRILTLAARRESIRHEVRPIGDVSPYEVTSHVWRVETRLGKAPGAVALGVAAAYTIALAVARATDAK